MKYYLELVEASMGQELYLPGAIILSCSDGMSVDEALLAAEQHLTKHQHALDTHIGIGVFYNTEFERKLVHEAALWHAVLHTVH